MKGHRYKPVGWRGESHRHYLAAKGVKTRHKYYAYAPTYVAGDLPLIAGDALGTAGASVVPWIPVIVPLALLYGGAKYVKKRKDKTGSYFADQDMMSFSPADLQAFDKEMESAKERGDDQFIFKGKQVLVSYGNYLSEYLHGKFDKQHFALKDELSDEADLRSDIDDDIEMLSAFEGVRSGLPLATQFDFEKGLQKKRDKLDIEVLSLAALEQKREKESSFFSPKSEEFEAFELSKGEDITLADAYSLFAKKERKYPFLDAAEELALADRGDVETVENTEERWAPPLEVDDAANRRHYNRVRKLKDEKDLKKHLEEQALGELQEKRVEKELAKEKRKKSLEYLQFDPEKEYEKRVSKGKFKEALDVKAWQDARREYLTNQGEYTSPDFKDWEKGLKK